ncbi:MAG: hypothetical protein ABI369_08425 [Acetobacteraceae bacterium]
MGHFSGMGRMQGFVADLLTHQGALVEPLDPDGLEVLAPPPVQRAMRLGEFSRLGFGTTLPAQAQRVGIEADWLQRFDGLLGERGRWTSRIVHPAERKPGDVDRLLDAALTLDNAAFRLLETSPAWTRYLILDFRFTALSDEKREGTVRLGINLATGVLAQPALDRLAPWLADPAMDCATTDDPVPPPAELPARWDRAWVLDAVERTLRPRLEERLRPFVQSLRRRLSRDEDRLFTYHNDLHHEATRRLLGLAEGDQGRQRERQRIEAIEREYRARLRDLAHKYAMRVTVEWVQAQKLAMPVHELHVQIRRRKAERTIRLHWNQATRRLEHPVCEFNPSAEQPRLVCDEALHLVSRSGLAACEGCDKPYCRACHRQACPKCGR